ncbi:MAG: hypothetical protein KAJ63_04650 [Methyloprofundus sp.]|nr:hypothetical protein [Methyloprofundus sp.]
MQISTIEENILSTVHNLPIEKQQEILDFSLFLKNKLQKAELKNHSSFSIALHEFLNEVKDNPLGIDTAIFDRDREQESGRDFQL